ncbi:MAG: hypothetical protein GC150_13365 [Rhizobiales bacterium]|nr:hypothetical protein [Hyphomicrobiales bacterium]
MLHVDIPTLPELRRLVGERADACVSIYLPTTPVTQDVAASRLALKKLAKKAASQLRAVGFDKRRLKELTSHIDDIEKDDEFWRLQANSLAVLATPERVRTFRLPNHLSEIVEVSDRFHLKPLLRSVTFPHEAFVLALSENKVRLVEAFAELPAREVKLKAMPKSASDAAGVASVNSTSLGGFFSGRADQAVLLRQYTRKVDAAVRALLAGRTTPLILAAAQPLESIFRSVNSYPHLLEEGIVGNADRMTPGKLAELARPVLDKHYHAEIEAIGRRFAEARGARRATTDIADAARAATFGAIEVLLVDMDQVVPGTVDDVTGAVKFAKEEGATTYGVVDEIAGRALASGAHVLAVRKEDIPQGASLAAILRTAL